MSKIDLLPPIQAVFRDEIQPWKNLCLVNCQKCLNIRLTNQQTNARCYPMTEWYVIFFWKLAKQQDHWSNDEYHGVIESPKYTDQQKQRPGTCKNEQYCEQKGYDIRGAKPGQHKIGYRVRCDKQEQHPGSASSITIFCQPGKRKVSEGELCKTKHDVRIMLDHIRNICQDWQKWWNLKEIFIRKIHLLIWI